MPPKPKSGLSPSPDFLQRRILADRKPAPRRFSEQEQGLRDLWNKPQAQPNTDAEIDRAMRGEFPILPGRPGIFRPDIPVVGEELGDLFNEYLKIAPNLKEKVTRIQYGPGRVGIERIGESQFDPADWAERPINLLGVTDMLSGEVNLNPLLGTPEYLQRRNLESEYGNYPPDEVLAHELTHASGYLSDAPDSAVKRSEKLARFRNIR